MLNLSFLCLQASLLPAILRSTRFNSECFQAMFDQPGFKMYRNLQDLLLKAVKGDDYRECLNHVTSLYHDDLDAQELQLHLEILQAYFGLVDKTSVTVCDIRDYILSLSPYERDLMSEVVTVLKLTMVLPSTNAVSERSFSALKRLKTYLRSTMKQDRLNHLLLLRVHKDRTDSLSLTHVAEQFVSSSEHRLSVFYLDDSRSCIVLLALS